MPSRSDDAPKGGAAPTVRRSGPDASRTFGFDGPPDDPPADAPLAGKYTLVRLLGAGGMASVYEAVHRNGHRVAIKVLHPTLARDAGLRDRFLREGYAANAVGHAGVVRVLDDDVADDGSVFLVMELLQGETLAARAERQGDTLPEPEVVAIGVALLDVLAAAHAQGVVHRDIKPDNLFRTDDGQLKVLDFGIAHVREAPAARVTLAGQQIGTPSFMAPEQARGRGADVDARTDLWAAGATLYALLCGQPVHGDGTAAELLVRAATQDAPPLRARRPDTAPALAAVLDRALRTDVSARWQSAGDMRAALTACAAEPDPVRKPAAPVPRVSEPEPAGAPTLDAPRSTAPRRRLVWAGLAAALVLGAGGVYARRAAAPKGPLPCASAAACAEAGTPARCAEGACRPLVADGCRLLAEPEDAARDDTVWLGAMFPLTGPEAEPFGEPSVRALELARVDFLEAVGGLPPVTEGGPVRHVAVVACDDSRDPAAVADHLIDNVGAPVVIGFARSREVTELALSHFHPRGVLALAANLAPSISELPLPSDGTRLVYRVTTNAAALSPANATFVADVLEPALRTSGAVGPDGTLRVALARVENASGVGIAASLAEKLRFNGRPALENGDAFRQVRVPDYLNDAISPEQIDRIADEFVAFAPHVIVGAGGLEPSIIAAVERRWTSATQPPPTYVTDWLEPSDVAAPLALRPDLRKRVYRVDAARDSRATQRFVVRYNERFTPPVTPSTALPEAYDAFYLSAFALAAAGPTGATDGRVLARAMPRLLPPGRPVEASADGIAGALATLSAGDSLDLQGAATGLDFDASTGDPAATAALYCLVERAGKLSFADAGVRFDPAGGLTGTLACE